MLDDEIDKILNKMFVDGYDVKKELLQLFDKSVERVIDTKREFGLVDDVPRTLEEYSDKILGIRRVLRQEQRQTWNKIKGEKKV